MKKYILMFGIIAALFVLWLITEDARNEGSYASNAYGFTFEYPEDYDLREYTEESIAIGDEVSADAFESIANIRMYQAGEDVGYESFDDFLFDTMRNMCAADGPTGSITCTEITDRQPFETDSNVPGEVFYMNRVEENFETGTTTDDGWGPIFAFDVSNSVDAQFAVLTVEPPVSMAPDEVGSELLRDIASSLEIGSRGENEKTSEYHLLVSVESTGDETVVVVDPVEWLDGDEAYRAVAEDTDCEVENAEECVPSLNNNFYIRNAEIEEIEYPVASDAQITLQENAQSVDATIGDVDLRLRQLNTPLVFTVETEEGRVVTLEEVYLP